MGLIEFKLPDIGEGVAEGEIISWKVKAGDVVKEDQVMVEVMTDKATVEIGAPANGRIVELKAEAGKTVPVGAVIIVLEAGATAAKAAPAAAPSKPAAKPAPPAPAPGDLEEVNFALPDIGEGVAEGEITKWLVSEGDEVREDQPMLEVMTDKATVEIGSPVHGKVLQILVPVGKAVPVGEVLLVLGARGAKAVARPAHAAATAKSGTAPVRAKVSATAQSDDEGGTATALLDTGLPDRDDGTRRVRAAPATRRLALELGVDVSQLNGTGPNGRVTLDDVRAAAGRRGGTSKAPTKPAPSAPAAARPAAPPTPARAPAAAPVRAPAPAAAAAAPAPHALEGDTREPLKGLRKRIAAQMRLSKQTAAHFTYVEEIDVTDLVKLRGAAKARAEAAGVKLTYMPFIVKAVLPALREFPLLNSSLDEAAQEIVHHGALNIGVAVDTPNGLVVPVVRQADGKTMFELAREMAELAERARAGKTKQEDIGGGTFTITNAGNIGGLLATPIINVPEVAILGVHAIRQRPWVIGGEIVVREIMLLSLSLDHRVVDGAVGARFMNRVKELLESPGLLLFEETTGAG